MSPLEIDDSVDFFSSPAMRELQEIDNILTRFAHELLNDSDEPIVEFHFGCGPDRIEWDDQDFTHFEFAPPIIISLDFEQLGAGRFNAMTPEGICGLLFRGRYRRRVKAALEAALALERKRVAQGYDSDLHIEEIRQNMSRAKKAILASFRAADRPHS